MNGSENPGSIGCATPNARPAGGKRGGSGRGTPSPPRRPALRSGLLALLLLFGLAIPSCSNSLFMNYGRISPAGGDARELESGVVRPELRYYTSGSNLYPNALIGLHRDYRLDAATLWKEVPMTPERLRETVGYMKKKASEYNQFPQEFALVGLRGQRVGFWYSLLSATTFLRFDENETVTIPTPELELYDKLEPKEDKD